MNLPIFRVTRLAFAETDLYVADLLKISLTLGCSVLTNELGPETAPLDCDALVFRILLCLTVFHKCVTSVTGCNIFSYFICFFFILREKWLQTLLFSFKFFTKSYPSSAIVFFYFYDEIDCSGRFNSQHKLKCTKLNHKPELNNT